MNCLVTGASGFIGRRLVAELLNRGDTVHYLGRKSSSQIDSRAVFCAWEGSSEPRLDGLPRIDAVVHLAGEPISQRWNREVKKRIAATRVEGTRKLVAALSKLQERPSVFVSASAVGYYGDRGDEVLTEQSAPGGGFLADVCKAWEAEAGRAQELGIRVVSVRIATVLGVEGGALKSMLIPFKLGLGGKFGNGRQWMSWIHLQDLVSLFLFAIQDSELNGAVNGASPFPLTNAEFTKELARAVHRPAFFVIPRFAIQIILGELGKFLFDSLRVIPQTAQQHGFRFAFPTLEAALRDCLSRNSAHVLR